MNNFVPYKAKVLIGTPAVGEERLSLAVVGPEVPNLVVS